MKFRKLPVVVEAFCFAGADSEEVLFDNGTRFSAALRDYRGPAGRRIALNADGSMTIPTLEGDHRAQVGDWVIIGVRGEMYPCKPDIFTATYEPADQPAGGGAAG